MVKFSPEVISFCLSFRLLLFFLLWNGLMSFFFDFLRIFSLTPFLSHFPWGLFSDLAFFFSFETFSFTAFSILIFSSSPPPLSISHLKLIFFVVCRVAGYLFMLISIFFSSLSFLYLFLNQFF